MCLPGTVVSCWSLTTQEVVGSSPLTVMTHIFVTAFSEFSDTFRKNSMFHSQVSWSLSIDFKVVMAAVGTQPCAALLFCMY